MLQDATHVTPVLVATVSAVLLALLAGLCSAGWARERDTAYRTLLELEARRGFVITSQEPGSPTPIMRKRPSLAPIPLDRLILGIVALIIGGYVVGGGVRVAELLGTT